MRPFFTLLTLLCAMLGAVLVVPASAQDVAPPSEAPAEAVPEAPRKPKPKPRPKRPAKPAEKPADAKAAKSTETPPQAPAPETGRHRDAPADPPDVASVPATPAAPVPTLAAAPSIVCEPGEAVRFEGLPKAAAKPGQATADPASIELWVTRTGSITIDNPLRPLTPDVTRVLQVVIGGKVATLYGPDVLSLRRGAGPAVLEGTIGGTIRWDASLNALPDTVPVLADSGDILAEFRFRACGTAPAARTLAAPKPRRTAPPADAAGLGAEAGKEAAKGTTRERDRPAQRAEPRPAGSAPRPAVPMPQGAIP
ncbi:hypothetical protein [Methylorubrum suomiense]|uniref:FecR protein domain-containing protein n=1 Tax=Methylorubrum suomiense TaxID=144191 RepID=A0ABQ4UYU2_9HYPH|nr:MULTISPECIES: hypothetical protein [Methylobacteriaceae]GJE76247.1 hypothetical protein BGCPKDLD_2839 [Methylorubrum suomiense]